MFRAIERKSLRDKDKDWVTCLLLKENPYGIGRRLAFLVAWSPNLRGRDGEMGMLDKNGGC